MPKYKDERNQYKDQLKNTVFEELESLREALDGVLEEDFKDDFDALLDALFSQYTQRNDMGNFVPMTEEAYRDVRSKYENCLIDYQNLPQLDRQNENVQSLGTALLRDRNALSGLPLDNLPPLAEVLHGAAISTVQMYTAGETVGEAVSSREAVEYTDKEGRVHQGFFTAEEHYPALMEDAYQQLAETLSEKYPAFKKTIREAVSDVNYKNNINYPDLQEKYVRSAPWMRRLSEKDKEAFWNVHRELNAGLAKIHAHYMVTMQTRIAPDAKLAQRSSAMTDVAQMLGFPDLLAKSHRVMVERNGEKIEGTMMELAGPDGVDRNRLEVDSPLFRVERKDFDNPDMLKSLANLQILDYLCANTDRHSRNFFVRFDTTDPEHPKVIGVQGIDNDNSFGEILDGKKQMSTAENLMIITPEMKEAVQNLTEASFVALLEDYGMAKNEINAAKVRLGKLHELIGNGEKQDGLHFEQGKDGNELLKNPANTIHIMKEDEWAQLSCRKLTPENSLETNIFTVVGRVIAAQEGDKEKALQNAEKKGEEKGLQFSKQNEAAALENIKKALQKEHQQLKEIEKRLDEKGKYANATNGSWQFRNTGRSVKWLVGKYDKILDSLSDSMQLDNKTLKQLNSFYNVIKLNKQKILDVTDTYINKDKVHIFRQGKERLKVAADLKDFMQKDMQDSEKLFAAQKKEREMWAQKSAYEVSAYASNQLRSMMDSALRENVMALKASDPNRALGLKAIKAQERLWNFSQRPTVPSENEKNQISAAQLTAMEDINTLLTFVKAQNPEANVPEMQKSLTAKQARSFLGAVYEQEMKLVNARKPLKADNAAKAKEVEAPKMSIHSGGRKL